MTALISSTISNRRYHPSFFRSFFKPCRCQLPCLCVLESSGLVDESPWPVSAVKWRNLASNASHTQRGIIIFLFVCVCLCHVGPVVDVFTFTLIESWAVVSLGVYCSAAHNTQCWKISRAAITLLRTCLCSLRAHQWQIGGNKHAIDQEILRLQSQWHVACLLKILALHRKGSRIEISFWSFPYYSTRDGHAYADDNRMLD